MSELHPKYHHPRHLKFVPMIELTRELEMRGCELLNLDCQVDGPLVAMTEAEKKCEKHGHAKADKNGMCTRCKRPVGWPAHTPDWAGWEMGDDGMLSDE